MDIKFIDPDCAIVESPTLFIPVQQSGPEARFLEAQAKIHTGSDKGRQVQLVLYTQDTYHDLFFFIDLR